MLSSLNNLCKAVSLAIHCHNNIHPQLKIQLYVELQKYASDIYLNQLKTETKINNLELKLKHLENKNNYYSKNNN